MVNDNLYTNEHYLAVGTSENQIELLGGDRHSNDAECSMKIERAN